MLREVDEGGRHTLVFRLKGRNEVRILNLDEWRADRSHENPFTTLMFFARQLIVSAKALREFPSIACELHRNLIDKLRIGERWRAAALAAHELDSKTHRLYRWDSPETNESLDLLVLPFDQLVTESDPTDRASLCSQSHDRLLSKYIEYLSKKHHTLELGETITMPVWRYMPDDRIFRFSFLEQELAGSKKRGRKPSAEKQRAAARVAELEARYSLEEMAEIIKSELGVKYSPETLRTYGSRFRNKK